LQIQRFIGRPMTKATSGSNPPSNLGFATRGPVPALPFGRDNYNSTDVNRQYASVYIEDTFGYKVTRDFTPAGMVFDSERCAWTFSRPLGPREQINMQFRTAGTVALTNGLYGVSMIGYREETA
jgi:hypothetical protein